MGCRLNIPVREMAAAKKGIADARGVKAEQYAQDELTAAQNKLLESHDRVAQKDVDGAKKAPLSLRHFRKRHTRRRSPSSRRTPLRWQRKA